MVDQFEVDKKFEDRQHEIRHFKLVINGRNYKGDYRNGTIQWLQPHPKQDVGEEELKAVEAEIHELLGGNVDTTENEQKADDETDDMEVEPMLENQNREMNAFKLKLGEEEFKGTFLHGDIVWFHPKPRRKLNEDRVEKVEEKVYEKMQEHKKN